MLKVKGNRIFDNYNKEIALRGYCIGNWMMMENFMMGFPGVEQEFRMMLEKYGGTDKKEIFFDTLLECYIQEKDIAFIKEVGCNVVRIAVNYRHFESDSNPFHYNQQGFRHLDRAVRLCRKYNIYIILDMHACPGYQNPDWHGDNYAGETRLFRDKLAQDRFTSLWRYIADYYKNEDIIAGYDLMNEPVAREKDEIAALNTIYRYAVKSIREVDRNHIIFIKGNMWGRTFDDFDEPFDDQLVYSCHFYADPGLRQLKYPGLFENIMYDKGILEQQMDVRDRFMRKFNVPCWIGEFGLLQDNDNFSEDKKRILNDQLDIFNERGHSWTLWSYKDIGNMGTLYPNQDTAWKKFTGEYIQLKLKYNCDYTGAMGEKWDLLNLMKPYYKADFSDFYEQVRDRIEDKLSRLFATMLAEMFTRDLAAFSINDLKELASSYEFDNCIVRNDWKEIVKRGLM